MRLDPHDGLLLELLYGKLLLRLGVMSGTLGHPSGLAPQIHKLACSLRTGYFSWIFPSLHLAGCCRETKTCFIFSPY